MTSPSILIPLQANPGAFVEPTGSAGIVAIATLVLMCLSLGIAAIKRSNGAAVGVAVTSAFLLVSALGSGAQADLDNESNYSRAVSTFLSTEYDFDVNPADIDPSLVDTGTAVVGTFGGQPAVVNLAIVDGELVAIDSNNRFLEHVR